MQRVLYLVVGLLVISACSSPADPTQGSGDTPLSEASESQAASSTVAPSASAQPSVDATIEPPAEVTVDELARTTVGNLSVRAEPSTAAERLGDLPAGVATFVIAGPVDAEGYTWYRLISAGSRAPCSGETSQFLCTSWVGWVAGITPEGDRWLMPFDPDCPPGRDTTTYLSMDAVTRLACAGNDDWRLVAYLAQPGGRGCFPVWLVDPFWMDPSCALFFPQPVQSEFDIDGSLQGFIPPELGACGPGGCPFDELRGSWVEIVGHLDDPVAEMCTSTLNQSQGFEEAPFDPPDSDLTVFGCRLNFVVTEVMATTPPSS